MQDLQITNCHFVVPCMNEDGEEIRVWVNQPSETELKSLARFLGPVFSLVRDQKMEMIVFLRDWEIVVDDIAAGIENGEQKLKQLDAFFERCMLTAKAFNAEGDELPELSADTKTLFKGALLFISALYRYTFKNLLMKEIGDFFTSLSATEYQSSLRKSQNQSTQPGVLMKRD